jgi:cytidine deaminase
MSARTPEPQHWTLTYLLHAGVEGLAPGDRELVAAAHAAALLAYAPYSKFLVGAALRMSDGQVVTGNNQENASFPAGICAERTALHAAMSTRPQGVVDVMAIVVPGVHGDRPVSPCGVCRQALLEQEHRQGRPMRLLLAVPGGAVLELESARSLLPLSFDASFLGG